MSKTVKDEPMTQSCGKCKWFEYDNMHYGVCKYEPLPIAHNLSSGIVHENEGEACPCFSKRRFSPRPEKEKK